MNNSIFFIINLPPNPRFVKQINYLSSSGLQVYVLFFNRLTMVDYSNNINDSVVLINLGDIESQKYFKRLILTIKVLIVRKQRSFLPIPRFIVVDNLFSLLIALTSRNRKQTKVYLQVADLRELIFNKGIFGRTYRFVEKFLVKHFVDKLIVTSEKYFEFFYSSFFSSVNVFLLENKPLRIDLPLLVETKLAFNSKEIRIGLVGGLNRGRTTRLLLDLVKENSNLMLNIHGLGQDEHIIKKYSDLYSNINFKGQFNFFRDIGEIYSEIDILYVVYDTFLESLNNKLALPNKLYEALYFKKPLIVSKDTYLAERVENYGIGIAVESNNMQQIFNAIKTISSNYESYVKKLKQVNENEYLGDYDYAQYIKLFV